VLWCRRIRRCWSRISPATRTSRIPMISVLAPHKGTIKQWRRSDTGRNRMTKVNEKIALITVTGGQFKEAGDVANHSQEVHISAPCSGKIHKLWVGVGDAFNEGDLLAEIEVCKHPALFNSLCVSCGDFVDPNRAAPVSSSTSNQAAGISDDTIRTPERIEETHARAQNYPTKKPYKQKKKNIFFFFYNKTHPTTYVRLHPAAPPPASSTNIPFYNKQLQLSASEAERYCILYVPSLH
jgi:hypothetical protein